MCLSAQAVTLTIVDNDGASLDAESFRWVLEEDATKESIPGELADGSNLGLSFHTSYMPVVAKGTGSVELNALALDADKRYYISVMPGREMVTVAGQPAYQLGGAQIAKGQDSVEVRMIAGAIPTAQISVFIFEDNQPINGSPDLPQEKGLGGFSLVLVEAGGTFGASGGQVIQNAFGDPIGTEYEFTINPAGKKTPVLEADGTPIVKTLGKGFVVSSSKVGEKGVANYKYLYPGKYTITAVPPGGSDPTQPNIWHQTSTIEGTKGIDAWVKGNEPSFFAEFGPPGHHAFIGFVKDINDTTALTGTQEVTGRIVNMHTARPPEYTFHNGEPIDKCRIGLNRVPGDGKAIFTAPCEDDGTFAIPNVAPGDYQLAVWDDPLDLVIGLTTVNVPMAGDVSLGDVPVFNWFHRHTSRVFYDANENGFWDRDDAAEYAIPEQAVVIRFRDGSIYKESGTDATGTVEFKELFPFFNWMAAEVDFARYKATGATVVVDDGGAVLPHDGWTNPSWDTLSPQAQADNGGLPYRTETGPVLVEGFQGFLGQTNVIEWGKTEYGAGENGGVSGIVQYAITRAENDPAFAAAEEWEPGVPRVQVNLYRDCNGDGVIDEPNVNPDAELPNTSSGCLSLGGSTNLPQLTDIDNYPFGWADGSASMGPEDEDRIGVVAEEYNTGWALDVASTDSWDDDQPTGCQGDVFTSNGTTTDCFDGLRNFNQVRPAVFDGGYAFGGGAGKPELEAGTYIVEANTPPGYDLLKEEDKNVDFGDSYSPSALALPAACVGDLHLVPAELTMFAGVESPYAGEMRPLCDRKIVRIADGLNAAANFFLFTEVPISGHIVGMILDDTSNEFDPNSPTFGERYAPSWVPVSIRDWTGKEISRVYADQWGTYNALVPSTFTVNPPAPSGVGPNMLTTCMNHAGPIIDDRPGSETFGQSIIDPHFQRQYSQFCYTFQYIPGKTTYLDTPVVPVAAFSGPDQSRLDCELDTSTPVIYSVTASANVGPYVSTPGADTLTIVSVGTADVSNPEYDGTIATTSIIQRDFGFGADSGTVTLNGVALPIDSWSNGIIVVSVPVGASTGQLEVMRGDNSQTTIDGVTVTVGGPAPIVVAPGGSIQAAVESAAKGDLILVAPGTYRERVIVDKQVRIQGWGAPSTVINVAGSPSDSLQDWRDLVSQKFAAGSFDLVPGQHIAFDAVDNEPSLFNTEEGPAFLVVAKATGPEAFDNSLNARIDGFTITGATHGGGIFVNGFANHLEISNNNIVGNSGTFGGGIRFGHPVATNGDSADVRGGYTDSGNDSVRVHHNLITQNGGINAGSVGGGIGISAGTDEYRITSNHICGNFSIGGGGGIGHVGHSANGIIDDNSVLFNESFRQGGPVHGGGILVAGQPARGAGPSAGSGSVAILNNIIHGNQAAAGDGGGISLMSVNGADVASSPETPSAWHQVTLQNNTITNNVAGLAGGVALQDVVSAVVSNNTIANNDSTATTGTSFAPGSPNESTPQSAGLVSRAHSASLLAVGVDVGTFSNPTLDGNILWHNRAFKWVIDRTVSPAEFGLEQGYMESLYSDLAVLGTAAPATGPQFVDTLDKLSPVNGVLTNTTGYDVSNSDILPPGFQGYVNGSLGETIVITEGITNLGATPAFDEGGNFIDVRFGPLSRNNCSISPCEAYGEYVLPVPDLPVETNFGALPPVIPFTTGDTETGIVDMTPDSTSVFVQCPGDTNGDAISDGGQPDNVKCMHLSGSDGFIRLGDEKRLYTFGFADMTGVPPEDVFEVGTLAAAFPAPTIELDQGDEFFLTLTNVGMAMRPDLFDPHSVHFHGFPQAAPAFDGMPEGSFSVNMGASLTYYYNVVTPGTFMYHCHVEATEHMQMGMLGNLYVRPAQDGTELGGYNKFVYNDGDGSTGYDKAYPLQITGMDSNYHDLHEAVQPLPFAEMFDTYAMLNGRGYPHTVVEGALPAPTMDDGTPGVQSQVVSSLMTLDRPVEGNTLLLRVSDLSVTQFSTLTALGLPMRVVGGGAAIARGPDGKDLYYETSSVTLGGGEGIEVIIDTTDVAAGTYFLYTTNLNYLSNGDEDYGGMMTEIVITGAAQ